MVYTVNLNFLDELYESVTGKYPIRTFHIMSTTDIDKAIHRANTIWTDSKMLNEMGVEDVIESVEIITSTDDGKHKDYNSVWVEEKNKFKFIKSWIKVEGISLGDK